MSGRIQLSPKTGMDFALKTYPPHFLTNFIHTMKSTIFLFFFHACLSYGCFYAAGQDSNQPEKFSVHAETMPPTTAVNVMVGNQSVTACYEQCQTQITLNYRGQALIEHPGQSPDVYAAQVFQLQPGEWIAEIDGGQYVKINAATGTAIADIAGQYCVFLPATN